MHCHKSVLFTLFIVLAPNASASAQGFFDGVGQTINKAFIDTGKAIEKGTQDTGKAIEKGTQDTGKAIEKGTQDTGNAIEKAMHDIGYALTVHPNDQESKAPPFYVPIRNECPYKSKSLRWPSYFSKATVVGVQFKWAKTLEPPRALGGIDPAACYAVTFDPKKGFGGHRAYGYSRKDKEGFDEIHARDGGLPGDPSKHQINVDGVLLRYNDGGEVYDLRGRVAGTLVCYLSNECEQYKYSSEIAAK